MNLAEMLQRPAWMADANCRGMDPELFFPSQGENTQNAAAKAVCRACDVQAECLAYAVNNGERFGVWGGLAENQRRKLRRECGVSERRAAECGTYPGGYRAHERAGEAPCDECRAARNEWLRTNRRGAA